MKKINLITLLLITMIFFITSCVQNLPTSKSGGEVINCLGSQIYNKLTRQCDQTAPPPLAAPPVPILKSINIQEGTDTSIILSYTDSENDIATSGTANLNTNSHFNNLTPFCLCAGGVCSITISPKADINNNYSTPGDLIYTLTDNDGVSQQQNVVINILAVDKPPTINFAKSSVTILRNQLISSFSNEVSSVTINSGDPEDIVSNVSLVFRLSPIDAYSSSLTSLVTGGIEVNSVAATGDFSINVLSTSTVSLLNFYVAAFDGVNYSADQLVSVSIVDPLNPLVSTLTPRVDTVITLPIQNKTLTPTSCTITTLINAYAWNCSCAADICTAKVGGIDRNINTATIGFEFTSFFSTTSSSVSFAIDNTSNSAPLIAMMDLEVNESIIMAGQTSYNFTLPNSYDQEFSTLTYSLKTAPTQGTLSGCLNGTSPGDCTYITDGSNSNSNAMNASYTFSAAGNDLMFTAANKGNWGNNLSIEFINSSSSALSPTPIVYVDMRVTGFPILKIYYNDVFSTALQIKDAVNNNIEAKDIFKATFTGTNAAYSWPSGILTMTGGVDGLDNFTIEVTDGDKVSEATFSINVLPQDDPPVICQYGNYIQTQECGIKGCIGSGSPDFVLSGKNIPVGIFYYDNDPTKGGSCYYKDIAGWIPQDPVALNGKLIPDITINEGDSFIISNLIVDEGGNDSSENNDSVTIELIASSNIILIPLTSIKITWGNAFVDQIYSGTALSLGDSAGSSDINNLKIEVSPIIGRSGNSTITLKIKSGSTETETSFQVTVNPSTVIHNGWVNVKALGPKVDSLGVPQENNCIYSEGKCNSGDCTGGSSPVSSIIPSEKNLIYLDSTNNICYISTGTLTNQDWKTVTGSCFQTDSVFDDSGSCLALGNRCVSNDSSSPPTFSSSTLGISYAIYDTISDPNNIVQTCYRNDGTGSWSEYTAPGEVTLSWNDFTVIGAGNIDGYNIFRTVSGVPMDYTYPINKTLIPHSTGVHNFTDNVKNSFFPPLPNTVYQYEVKAFVNNINSGTSAIYSKIKVVVPPDNKAFVLRRIANKVICEKMHLTYDKLNNNRCVYSGPGDVNIGGTSYYDIGTDLIVDRFEAGCPYTTTANACAFSTSGLCLGAKIGIDLNGTETAAQNTIYYSRTNGTCYRNTDGGTTWAELSTGAAVTALISSAHLPPLVNVNKDIASNFCEHTVNQGINDDNILGYTPAAGNIQGRLLLRKEQIVAFQYDDSLSDSQISALESGASIHTLSTKCNTSSANGLEADFLDLDIPPSAVRHTTPGTSSSGIRSLITGSDLTKDCQSRFGLQDHVGNVAEISFDTLDCGVSTFGNINTNVKCVGVENISGPFSSHFRPTQVDFSFTNFILDGLTGPCIDSNADGNCDGALDQWPILQKNYNSTKFSLPMGLPIVTSYSSFVFPGSDVAKYMLDIGPSTGILSAELHDDMYKFNLSHIFSSDTKIASLIGGGSYLDGLGAGTYFLGLKQKDSAINSYIGRGYLLNKRPGANAGLTVDFVNPDIKNAHLEVDVNGTAITIFLATDPNNTVVTNGKDIVDAITKKFSEEECQNNINLNTVEQQTINFSAQPSSGSFTLSYNTSSIVINVPNPLVTNTISNALNATIASSLGTSIDPWLKNVKFSDTCALIGAGPNYSCVIRFEPDNLGPAAGSGGTFDHPLFTLSNNTMTGITTDILETQKGVLPNPCDEIFGYIIDNNLANEPLSPFNQTITFSTTGTGNISVDTGFRCAYPIDSQKYK